MHVFRASFDWKRVPLTRPRTRKTRLATSSPSCWQELAPPTHQSPLDEPTMALTPDPARGLVRPVASRAGSCIPANPGVGPGHRRLPVSTPAACQSVQLSRGITPSLATLLERRTRQERHVCPSQRPGLTPYSSSCRQLAVSRPAVDRPRSISR